MALLAVDVLFAKNQLDITPEIVEAALVSWFNNKNIVVKLHNKAIQDELLPCTRCSNYALPKTFKCSYHTGKVPQSR